jgi:predicted outer membrane protein
MQRTVPELNGGGVNLTDREKDGLQALLGTAKSAASMVPGLGQAIAGHEAYQQSAFKRQVESAIKELASKVEDLTAFFQQSWFKNEDIQKFSRKVFDCAFDAQIEDKQELFVNALINGVQNQNLSNLEKLKFVSMLPTFPLHL